MQDETDVHYAVITTATAKAAIREQVRFIVVEQRAPRNAAEWLGRVWACIDGLEYLPKRFPPAEGYERLSYVVRRAVLDNHLILFMVDESSSTVYVVGLRHGSRLPRPSDLPTDPKK
jgi:hypothetical protein